MPKWSHLITVSLWYFAKPYIDNQDCDNNDDKMSLTLFCAANWIKFVDRSTLRIRNVNSDWG